MRLPVAVCSVGTVDWSGPDCHIQIKEQIYLTCSHRWEMLGGWLNCLRTMDRKMWRRVVAVWRQSSTDTCFIKESLFLAVDWNFTCYECAMLYKIHTSMVYNISLLYYILFWYMYCPLFKIFQCSLASLLRNIAGEN